MAKVITDQEIDKGYVDFKKVLDAQPKRQIRIPLGQRKRQELEAALAAGKKVEWPSTPVQLNGVIYQIQHGHSVDVPESIALVLQDASII